MKSSSQTENQRTDPSLPLVVFVHGIRTEGEWIHRIRKILEPKHCVAEAAGYAFFSIFRFLIPGLRSWAVNTVHRKIKHAIAHHAGRDLILVAHSFGTYCVTKILENDPDIQPVRMLFCGSIVDQQFEWNRLRQFPKSGSGYVWVVNECGTRDIWPALAHSMTWGYGNSGSGGFQIAGVFDRRHDLPHSGFFTDEFVINYWLPFIQSGNVVNGGDIGVMPWWRHVIGLRPILPWLAWLLIIFFSVVFISFLGSNNSDPVTKDENPAGPIRASNSKNLTQIDRLQSLLSYYFQVKQKSLEEPRIDDVHVEVTSDLSGQSVEIKFKFRGDVILGEACIPFNGKFVARGKTLEKGLTVDDAHFLETDLWNPDNPKEKAALERWKIDFISRISGISASDPIPTGDAKEIMHQRYADLEEAKFR